MTTDNLDLREHTIVSIDGHVWYNLAMLIDDDPDEAFYMLTRGIVRRPFRHTLHKHERALAMKRREERARRWEGL